MVVIRPSIPAPNQPRPPKLILPSLSSVFHYSPFHLWTHCLPLCSFPPFASCFTKPTFFFFFLIYSFILYFSFFFFGYSIFGGQVHSLCYGSGIIRWSPTWVGGSWFVNSLYFMTNLFLCFHAVCIVSNVHIPCAGILFRFSIYANKNLYTRKIKVLALISKRRGPTQSALSEHEMHHCVPLVSYQ